MATMANIDSGGVDSRLRSSVLSIGATLVVMVLLARFGAPVWAFALLFFPFFLAVNLAYQGLFKT
jgi:hypothetical protein